MPYASLGDFLVNAPLYQAEVFPTIKPREHQSGTLYYITAPEEIDRNCATCGPTRWEFTGGSYQRQVQGDSLEKVRYVCKNCEKTSFSVWIIWWTDGPVYVLKAGQYPKLEITIPKEFGDALGKKRPLYVKGMTLRHNAYGIGALTYFRRVIEDTTDEMLDLLEEAMRATGADPGALAALKKAKAGPQFEDKVRIAAEVLPANLRPNNVNPFGDLLVTSVFP